MAHPHAAHRQSKVERARVPHITRGYASGGAVGTGETVKEKRIARKVFAERDAQAVEGGSVKERMDRPGRARGGRAPKHNKGTNVNVIVAPQGGHGTPPALPPVAGVAPPGLAPPSMPMRPPMPAMAGPPPGPGLPPPGMAPPGMPPRNAGGRTYAKGGRVKSDAGVASGRAWEEGKRNGTQMQNNPSGKNDQGDVNRGKPITYKTGGAIYSASKGQMGPKFDGGAGGGEARLQKESRAARKYTRA